MLIDVSLSLCEVLSVLYIARLPVLRREPVQGAIFVNVVAQLNELGDLSID